jgi:beta-glucosidase
MTMHPTVSELTLHEKATLLTGASFWSTAAVDRAGVEAAVLTDGPHGVRLQRTSSDNLGIFDSEPATAFPTAATTGSTWDPELLEALGVALGKEARALGVDVLLGPGVNIKRSPLCGRNFEYFSEDPLLSGALGAAWVRGIQSQGVGASVKHFAANNQETERMRVSAEVDERTLREIYLPAFEHIVRTAAPATVMCSYNRINGVYASENHWLLTEVLRDEWGFDGYVMSDWGAVHSAVDAVAAGLDLTMPAAGDRHVRAVVDAVEAGTLPIETIDLAVSRILSVHERLRALQSEAAADVDIDAHHELARRLASAGSVLLTNDGMLPLAPSEGGPIAVVGEFARTPRYQGAGSSHINPHRVDTALAALTEATEREVRFAPGFRLDGAPDETLIDEAVEAARDASSIVLFLGLPDQDESEGFDRQHLDLPRVQLELLDRLLAARSDIVVVLSNGSVVDLSPLAGRVAAILETWLGGQASGSAVADMLFGRSEPGGRLAETIPLRLSDTPSFVNFPGTPERVLYGERFYVGYRWYDSTARDVAFPFGFGLGYTSWSIDEVAVAVPDPSVARATVAFTVTNTGPRAGSQVVQVYVGDPVASVDRPTRELKAFTRLELAAGESRRVELPLDERAFAFWAADGWTVEPGRFVIEVGTSSRDIVAARQIELAVPAPTPTLKPDSTLAEWLGHPVGNPVLTGALEQSGAGTLQFLEDDTARRMMEQMPLRVIFGFGGSTDGAAAVNDLLLAVDHAAG